MSLRCSEALRSTFEALPGQDEPLAQYADDPEGFFRDTFGIQLYDRQREILTHVRTSQETWVRSGNGVGKTTLAALVAEYWFSVLGRPVMTTAPTFRQVDDLLWGQGIRTLRSRATRVLPGKLAEGKPRVKSPRPDWFMRGWSTDRPERAQGPHLDNLLIIVDEASGVNKRLFAALKGWMTNPGCRLLCIGNPSADRTTPFWEAFHERSGEVATVHIKVGDSPFVSREWIDARKREWGEDSDEYRARVLGEFPKDEDEKALPMAWCEASVQLWEERPAPSEPRWKKWTWDVAGKGKDANALTGLDEADRAGVVDYWHEPDMLKSAIYVVDLLKALPKDRRPKLLLADVTGRGEGAGRKVEELLRLPENAELAATVTFIGVDFGSGADDPVEYHRKVDELYGRFRKALNPAAAAEERIALPPDWALPAKAVEAGLTTKLILAQLNTRRKGLNDRGRFKVESKTELKRRGIKSPDIADAMVLLMHTPPPEVNIF